MHSIKLLAIVSCILLVSCSTAKKAVDNKSYNDVELLSNGKENILYLDVVNPIKFNLELGEVTDITCPGAKVVSKGNNEFDITPSPVAIEQILVGDVRLLTLNGKNERGESFSKNIEIRVNHFSPPYARIVNDTSGSFFLGRADLCRLNSSSLEARTYPLDTNEENYDSFFYNELYDKKYEVVSWEVIVQLSRDDMPRKASANVIAAACEEPNAKGSSITFYNIEAKAIPEGNIIDLEPIWYIIE